MNYEIDANISNKLNSLEDIYDANYKLLIKSNELLDSVEYRIKEIRNN